MADEVAVGGQGLDLPQAVTDRVAEEIGLFRDARKLARLDPPSERVDGVAYGHNEDGLAATTVVQFIDLLFQLPAPGIGGRLQNGQVGRIAFGVLVNPPLRGRGIEGHPRSLHQQPQVGIVEQSQIDEILDPLVGDLEMGGHREDVDLTAGEGRPGLILAAAELPVLDHPRTANPLPSYRAMPLNPRRCRQLVDALRHEHVKAVPCVKDTLAGGNLLRGCRRADEGQGKQARQSESQPAASHATGEHDDCPFGDAFEKSSENKHEHDRPTRFTKGPDPA